MKIFSRTFGLTALLCMALMATAARAQDDHTMPAPPASDAPAAAATAPSPDAAGKKDSANKMVKRMAKTLSLTPDQKKQVKALAEDRQTQIDAMNADTSITGKAKKQKMHSIQTDFDNKVNAILTDDQKTEYAKMKEDQKAKRKGGAAPADAPAAPAAAPDSQ